QLDLDEGMGCAQGLEVVEVEQIAVNVGVRDDSCGAGRAINQGQFTEGHAWRKRGQSFLDTRVQLESDADLAAREKEQLAGLIASADDNGALIKGTALEQRGD